MRRTSASAAVAAGLLAATAAACSGGGGRGGPAHGTVSARSPQVLLTHGSRNGIRWGLWAWEQPQNGRRVLCMDLSGPDRYAAAGAPGVPPTGGCAFNDRSPGSGYYASGLGPGSGTSVSFGPLPVRAATIRVAGITLPTYPLPSGRGLPRGRYWIRFASSRVTGTTAPSSSPVPLDAHGHRVPFQPF